MDLPRRCSGLQVCNGVDLRVRQEIEQSAVWGAGDVESVLPGDGPRSFGLLVGRAHAAPEDRLPPGLLERGALAVAQPESGELVAPTSKHDEPDASYRPSSPDSQ